MGALNTTCEDSPIAIQDSGSVKDADRDSPSKRWGKRAGLPRERWSLRWTNLTKTEVQAVRAIIESAGFTGKILWTPPDEGADKAFKIAPGSVRETAAWVSFDIRFNLILQPGVTPA